MRKITWLALWVAGILFPIAWFSQQIPGFDQWFNRIFAPQWMHVLMHAFLYGVLAAGIVMIWPRCSLRTALAAALLVGIAQEVLQPLPAGRLPGSAALFDLAVDLCGAAAGLAVLKIARTILFPRKSAIERNV